MAFKALRNDLIDGQVKDSITALERVKDLVDTLSRTCQAVGNQLTKDEKFIKIGPIQRCV